MQYFGEPWDAPVCDPDDPDSVPQAATPVGRPCMRCKSLINDGDQGLLIPYAPEEGAPSLEPWHRLCFMRDILGPNFDLDQLL